MNMLGATKAEWLDGIKPALCAAAFSVLMTALDFTLTYFGVSARSVNAEANPFLRGMMREVGPMMALVWSTGPTWFYALLCVLPGKVTRRVGIVLSIFSGIGHLMAALTWTV